MNNAPLVSMIIPCYNGETTLRRCLNSILEQTYKHLEIIVVNDGSTDNSEEIILSYEKRFFDERIIFKYVYQENQGLAGAINAGLAIFSGEYLCWFDCDDYLFPNSVLHRLLYLEENPNIASVTSDAYFYEESDLINPVKKASDGKPDLNNPYQMEYMLKGEAIFCPGCHMVRTRAFLDVHPTRSIYPARRGQNWQMLLPIYYKYNQAFLDEPLYAYIIYKTSMSSGDKTKEQYLKRYNEHLDIIQNTLDSMEMIKKDRERYERIYQKVYKRQLFYLGVSFHDYKMLVNNMIWMIINNEWKKNDTKWLKDLIINNLKK